MRWLLVALGALMLAGVAAAAAPAPVVTTSSTPNSITLGSLQCGKRYHVRVQVYDSRGALSTTTTLDPSTSACAPPPPAPPPPPPVAPPPPPPSGADFYVSPTGSDANPCSAAAPCLSLNRAYDVAACGQTVEVAGGSYADQDVVADPSKAGCVVSVLIRPALGAAVTIGAKTDNLPPSFGNDHGLSIEASRLTIQGPFTLRGELEISGATSTVVNGVTAIGGNLYLASPTSGVQVCDSSFGGTNRYMTKVWLGPSGGQNVNWLLCRDTFHDVNTDDLAYHVEGILIIESASGAIRDSTFTNNSVFDVSAGECCGSDLAGTLAYSGNHFGSARSGVSDYTVASVNFNTNTPSSSFPAFDVRGNDLASGVSGTAPAGTYCGNTGNAPASWQTPC